MITIPGRSDIQIKNGTRKAYSECYGLTLRVQRGNSKTRAFKQTKLNKEFQPPKEKKPKPPVGNILRSVNFGMGRQIHWVHELQQSPTEPGGILISPRYKWGKPSHTLNRKLGNEEIAHVTLSWIFFCLFSLKISI